jgi:hypothetical protein
MQFSLKLKVPLCVQVSPLWYENANSLFLAHSGRQLPIGMEVSEVSWLIIRDGKHLESGLVPECRYWWTRVLMFLLASNCKATTQTISLTYKLPTTLPSFQWCGDTTPLLVTALDFSGWLARPAGGNITGSTTSARTPSTCRNMYICLKHKATWIIHLKLLHFPIFHKFIKGL